MSRELSKGLTARHLYMIAIGGTIGSGIFQGSKETISAAGPGVVVTYLLAGIILFFVMSSLAEMASSYPGKDLKQLIDQALGYRVSFISGWLYWFNWIVVLTVDIVAAGTFLHYWYQSTPVWQLALICALFIVLFNLFNVRVFGEVEFWLSAIKVGTLIAFVLVGAKLLFLGVDDQPGTGLAHYTDVGGFFPQGVSGVIASLVIVIFSFGGSEMIGLTISETKNAQRVLPRVLRGVIVRISLFYVLPILIIVGLVPWNRVGTEESPFVQVFSTLGLSGAASLMNFVMLIAVLSAANSALYATSRLLYSLAKDREAPQLFARLSRRQVPYMGIAIGTLCMLCGAWISFAAPDQVFAYLMGIPGYTVLLMWIAIVASQIRLRQKKGVLASFHVSGYPWSSWLVLLILCIIFITMLVTSQNMVPVVVVCIVLVILVLSSYFITPSRS